MDRFARYAVADEPAWKIHLELVRRTGSGFRPAGIWQVNDAIVPLIEGTNEVNQSARFLGQEITLKRLALYDTGNRFPLDLILRVEVGYPKGVIWMNLLKVTDQRGKEIAFQENSTGGVSGYVLYPFSTESQKLNLKFAVHQSVSLEFIAKPRLVHENIARPEF